MLGVIDEAGSPATVASARRSADTGEFLGWFHFRALPGLGELLVRSLKIVVLASSAFSFVITTLPY